MIWNPQVFFAQEFCRSKCSISVSVMSSKISTNKMFITYNLSASIMNYWPLRNTIGFVYCHRSSISDTWRVIGGTGNTYAPGSTNVAGYNCLYFSCVCTILCTAIPFFLWSLIILSFFFWLVQYFFLFQLGVICVLL